MTVEKPERYGPFKMKDQRDGFMEPLPGRLSLTDISKLDEIAVDSRLEAHMKGASVLNEAGQRLKPWRMLEIKKMFLAVLEGYPPTSREMADWLNEERGNPEEPVGAKDIVNVSIFRFASEAYKERRAQLRSDLLFEAELTDPLREETESLVAAVNKQLRADGLPEMSLREILVQTSLQRGNPEVSGKFQLMVPISDRLKLFQLLLDKSLSITDIAQRFGKSESNIRTWQSKYLTLQAKRAIREARGFDPLAIG